VAAGSPATMIPDNDSLRHSSPRKRTRCSVVARFCKVLAAARLDEDYNDEDDNEDYTDEDDDKDYKDEEEPSNDNARLSKLPTRRRAIRVRSQEEHLSPRPRARAKPQTKKYEGRRLWTDEEKSAIMEGIRQLGKSKWAGIKELYGVILNDRTSMQIKVCSSNCFHHKERDAILASIYSSCSACFFV
jgi:hypothetical protein